MRRAFSRRIENRQVARFVPAETSHRINDTVDLQILVRYLLLHHDHTHTDHDADDDAGDRPRDDLHGRVSDVLAKRSFLQPPHERVEPFVEQRLRERVHALSIVTARPFDVHVRAHRRCTRRTRPVRRVRPVHARHERVDRRRVKSSLPSHPRRVVHHHARDHHRARERPRI